MDKPATISGHKMMAINSAYSSIEDDSLQRTARVQLDSVELDDPPKACDTDAKINWIISCYLIIAVAMFIRHYFVSAV